MVKKGIVVNQDTVGKIASDLLVKQTDRVSPIDQMREQLSEYDDNIRHCAERFKKLFGKDFFIVVITKRERLLENVIRNYFTGRLSCPTPDYDQTVYKYTVKDDNIQFLWVVPSKDTCYYLKSHENEVVAEEQGILNFVRGFFNGKLLSFAKYMNNESLESPFLQGVEAPKDVTKAVLQNK